jgi:hypothetical protein
MPAFVSLIEAVEAEGFGWGGVVAPAFGNVQVAGVFDGRDDGGADGGQVGGPAAGAAGGGIFAEGHVLDGPDGAPRWTTARGPGGPHPGQRVNRVSLRSR